MKIYEIIHEAPQMVPQDAYPPFFAREAKNWLKSVTMDPSELKEKYRDGDIRIMSLKGSYLFVFVQDLAVGMMHLVDTTKHYKKYIGAKRSWQVMNVFILPEHRNRRLGMMLYNYVLHHKKDAFSSGAAMTPASRRIYTSLLKDPSVDVYALVQQEIRYPDPISFEREELHIGPDGVTTGDSTSDQTAVFVAVAK